MDEDKVKRTRILSIIEGSFFNGFALITQGFLGTGLALQYGASEPVIAVLGMLPAISQLVQVFSPLILQKVGNRKKTLVLLAGVSSTAAALVPVTLAIGWNRQEVLLIVLALFTLFNNLAGNMWISLMKDITPPGKTGRYFGTRNLVFAFVNMGITILYSRILDAFPGRSGFLIILSAGAANAMVSLFLLSRHYDPPHAIVHGRKLYSSVIRDIRFRPFLVFSLTWSFAIALTGPFFPYHQLVNLKLDYTFLGMLTIISTPISMLLFPIWGRVADKIGSQAVLEFGVFGAAVKIVLWLFINPRTVFLLYIDSVMSPVVWSAINLCFFTVIIDLFDGVNAESYFAVLAFANGSSTLLGSLSGGLLAGVLKDYTVQFSGFQFYGIQALFVGTIVLRLTAWRFLKRVKTRKDSSVPRLIMSSTSVVSARIARWPRETIAVFEAIKERYDNRKKRR